MQNTLKHKMPFSGHLLIPCPMFKLIILYCNKEQLGWATSSLNINVQCQSRRKQISFVKTLRNIHLASSTFIFETQAIFHPAGAMATVFVVPGKVTVELGDGRDAGIKVI